MHTASLACVCVCVCGCSVAYKPLSECCVVCHIMLHCILVGVIGRCTKIVCKIILLLIRGT